MTTARYEIENLIWKTSMRRPTKIKFTAIDPMDDAILTIATLPYDRRRSAMGMYTRYHKRMVEAAKAGVGHILEGREPVILTELVYENP